MTPAAEGLERIATALERIATVAERFSRTVPTDGRALSQAVARHTLSQAIRTATSIAGGKLANQDSPKHDD